MDRLRTRLNTMKGQGRALRKTICPQQCSDHRPGTTSHKECMHKCITTYLQHPEYLDRPGFAQTASMRRKRKTNDHFTNCCQKWLGV